MLAPAFHAPAVTRDEADQLIQQLDAKARRDPKGFTARVAAFAAFGYAYMLGVLLLSLTATALLIWMIFRFPNGLTIKLGLMFGLGSAGMAWSILSALWVRTEDPEGLALTAAEAPELFLLLAEIGRKLDAPPFHRVLLVSDYNASVVQVPRLGVFGWHRNFLLLGLPLLLSLSREEFAAVLAHEFGHLSRSHGRLGNWLYRLRRSWERVFEGLVRNPPGKLAWVLTAFVDWFWPRFNARAFVLSRTHEYEADAAAARATSSRALGSALSRLVVDAPLLDEQFWPAVYRRTNTEAAPPPAVFEELGQALRAGADPADSARWLRAGFLVTTNNADTHPCLADRLRALGQLPAENGTPEVPSSLPARAGPDAAQALLGDRCGDWQRRLSERWRKAVAELWRQRHAEAVRLQQELAGLEAVANGKPPTPDELWQRAELKLQLGGDAAAVPLLDQLLALRPNHPVACLVRGRHLLEADDPDGVGLVERAVTEDSTLTEAACQLLAGHFARTGQTDRLRSVVQRLDAFGERQRIAQRERDTVTAADTFRPHGLAESVLAPLRQAIAAEGAVRRAHLACKEVQVFPENPCYVLALVLDRPFWKPASVNADQQVVNRVVAQLSLSGYVLVFVADKNLKSLGARIAEQAESLVYQRAE